MIVLFDITRIYISYDTLYIFNTTSFLVANHFLLFFINILQLFIRLRVLISINCVVIKNWDVLADIILFKINIFYFRQKKTHVRLTLHYNHYMCSDFTVFNFFFLQEFCTFLYLAVSAASTLPCY